MGVLLLCLAVNLCCLVLYKSVKMVRTKADATVKVSAAKAPRKVLAGSGGGGASSFMGTPGKMSKNDKHSGGNSVQVQPTPDWQKGINSFFKPKPSADGGDKSSSPDKSSPTKDKEN